MSNYYTYKPSIGSTGQYIASGRPWIKALSSPLASGATETFSFPAVTRTVTIINSRDMELYFNAAAPAENKLPLLATNSPHTLHIKCRELFVTNVHSPPAAGSLTVVAGLTGIEEEYVLTGSGITEP